jgi:Acetyltransferases, including N-acetylases of ribosomal proteins
VNPTITLRAVTEDDLPIFFEHQRDPEAVRLADFPSRDRDAFFPHWERILADPASQVSTIVADGAVVGNVVCWETGGERLVGYWIGREHWGRGIATRALEAFLREVAARPLHARVAKGNAPSIRVLEKCGFVRAGEEGEEYVYALAEGGEKA